MIGAPEKCVAETRHDPLARSMARTIAMQRAAELVSQPVLAAGMGIPERTLRSYVGTERRLPAIALNQAATALKKRALELLQHAEKLEDLAK